MPRHTPAAGLRLEEAGARALAADAWARLETEAHDPDVERGVAWPATRCEIDILDPLLRMTSRLPYAKGALFYRAVESRIGRPRRYIRDAELFDDNAAAGIGL